MKTKAKPAPAKTTVKRKATATNKVSAAAPTARTFMEALQALQANDERSKNERFVRPDTSAGSKVLGVRMGKLFALAKAHSTMSLPEVEKLLDNAYYEGRMGAVCIMDFQARNKKTSDQHRKALYDLYLRRHDRIDNWDMVDRSATFVIGGYLFDKPRTVLRKLAKSANVWERRTAIVATAYFIRQRDVNDTFAIAELLVNDPHDLIQKAVGSWVREAGKQDKLMLRNFLDQHAATMPRTALRYAIEKLDAREKKHYMAAKGAA